MQLDDFKALELEHKKVFDRFLSEEYTEISELTFTNLFMWRHKYRPLWAQEKGCLFITLTPGHETPFGLQPVGSGDKKDALNALWRALEEGVGHARICRVSEDFVRRHVDLEQFDCTFDQDQSDYVYATQDLIQLAGRKYHKKKNQLNRFFKNHTFQYWKLDIERVECFLDMQENWCHIRECAEDPGLLTEDYAIRDALIHFGELDYEGGAIEINGRLEAISIGGILNPETAVIHIEKANPEIPGLYAAINQLFCENAWSDVSYINREQDLGIEGLRKAKQSYHPHHLVKKYVVTPKH